MNKNFNFPCIHNASDVIRKQRDQAIYNPCVKCSLQQAVNNNNMLNNESPMEGQVITYTNGSVQWDYVGDTGSVENVGQTGPTGPAGPTGPGGGGSQNLASVLAVSPAGVADAEQTITLSKVGYLSAEGTNVVSGSGMEMDFQGTGGIYNLSFKNDVTPNATSLKQYDSTIFPPIDNQPQNETYSEAGKIEIKNTQLVDDVVSTNTLSLQPTRIGLSIANGIPDYGLSGQVLTSGGGNGNLTWSASGGGSSLQEVLNNSNSADDAGSNVGTIQLSVVPDGIGLFPSTMTMDGDQLSLTKTESPSTLTSTLTRSSLTFAEDTGDVNRFQDCFISNAVISSFYNFGVKTAGGVLLKSIGGIAGMQNMGEGIVNITHTEATIENVKTKECSLEMKYDTDASSWGFTTLDAVAETTVPLLFKQDVSIDGNLTIDTLKLTPTSIGIGDGTTYNYGTTGQVLTSGGEGGQLTWSAGGGSGGPTGGAIQIIDSSYTGNVASTLLDTPSLYGIVFISPDTDGSTVRNYYLPFVPPLAYTVTIRNCSSESWNVINTEVIAGVTGTIFGNGATETAPTYGINHLANQTIVYKYLGAVSVGGIVRSCWIT